LIIHLPGWGLNKVVEMLYFIILFLAGFLFPVLFSVYALYCIYGDIKGAPYVPTTALMVDEILRHAKLEKGQRFLELGSGDGRVVRRACGRYGVVGCGVDIHALLIIYSRLLARLQGQRNVRFLVQDFFVTDLRQADVLFLFLLPKTLKSLREKIVTECKKGTLIISHGFKIEGLEKMLESKIDRKLFPTYYYRVP
jgi:SAM-dependent methyltransferase